MKLLDTDRVSLLYNIWEKSFKLTKEIWYSLFMNEESKTQNIIGTPAACVGNELKNINKTVTDFLSGIGFIRICPVDLVSLVNIIGGYKIHYISPKADGLMGLWGLASEEKKLIMLNPMFDKGEQEFLKGRYILAKLIAKIALKYSIEGLYIEGLDFVATEEQKKQNKIAAAFACELLMPEDEFRSKYNSSKDEALLSRHFQVTQKKILQRIEYLKLVEAPDGE